MKGNMCMKLKDYIWEIFSIAHENSVDTGIAKDMFTANLRLGSDKYHGADMDYETLGDEWDKLPIENKIEQEMEYNRVVDSFQTTFQAAWNSRDRKLFDAIIADVMRA